ncbi:MAG: DUF4785 domain-containing protein, partial [Arenimonas sp.]
ISSSRLVNIPVPAGQFERKAVSFAYALNPQNEVVASTPFTAESREYWIQVEGGELSKGLMIDTTASGALIRISPATGAAAIVPGELKLLRNGKAIESTKAFSQQANTKQLQQAGMDVTSGTAIVKIADGQGQGRFQLMVPKASGRYLVHVFEPNSDVTLQAKANRQNYLAGDQLVVNATLARNDKAFAGTEISGLLVSPSGKTYDIKFTNQNGALRAVSKLPSEVGQQPGLWEVQVLAGASDGKLQIQRDARTVISIAQPTAKLNGEYRFNAQALSFTMPIQVGSPGRYELTGTLFATGRDGVSRPVAQAAMANWFKQGNGVLNLNFDRSNLPAGYGAPFELKFLELKDQTRMTQLESRETAARVGTQR